MVGWAIRTAGKVYKLVTGRCKNEKCKEAFSRYAADSAVHSLIEEVELTPKPGLVDRVNNGAHQDLTIELMRKSALSLKETFEQIAFISYGNSPSLSLREEIAAIGRNGENRMFETTGGVNTHKGAIWAIGLLVSGAAMGKGCFAIKEIVSLAGETARYQIDIVLISLQMACLFLQNTV